MSRTVRMTRDGDVAFVTLDRPEVRNAFNADMIADIGETFASLSRDESLRVAVLSGAGPAFSAGADANWMRASLDFSYEDNVADAERMSDMFDLINTVPFALIGRVHGACLGGGMGLISVCDLVISADTAQYGFTEARLGIIPSVISRFVLPKIGERWARALYLTAERFDANLAREIGLVHWVVPEGELDNTVQSKILELRAGGPEALIAAKRLIQDLHGADPIDVRRITAERIAQRRASLEGQEGLRAFLEKRKPSWREGE